MPIRTEYAPGTPSFVDLATPDTVAARDFYAALFGWEYAEEPAGPDNTYIMASKDGRAAAGMMELSAEMAAGGMPPVWSSYVTVEDVEASVGKVEAAGGAVMRPAMDVMEAGRMAVVADPSGAVFCLWQPKDNIGAELCNEHGSFTWNELMTPDVEAVAPFYAGVFGWTAEAMPMPDGPAYTVFSLAGDQIAGAMAPPMPGMPPAWGIYFAVDDCDAAVDTAKARGATVLVEPMDSPPGRMAALTDPQGAAFSVMALAEPPT